MFDQLPDGDDLFLSALFQFCAGFQLPVSQHEDRAFDAVPDLDDNALGSAEQLHGLTYAGQSQIFVCRPSK